MIRRIPARMNVRSLSFDRDRLAGWRRRLPAFVEIALVLLLVTQAARLLWMLLVPAAPVGSAAAVAPTQAMPPALPVADVFFRTGSGPLRASGTSEALGYTLHGVRSDGSGGSAILGKDGRQASHAVGREVAPGITLESVGVDHAVLVSGGERHRLQLPRHSARQATSQTATLPTGSRATASTTPASSYAPRMATTPATATAATANSRKSPSGPGPATQAQDGYTITAGSDNALLRSSGLQAGDVVTSVNGRPLDPARLAGLKDEFDGQSQVTIQYRRDGKTHTTTVKAPQ